MSELENIVAEAKRLFAEKADPDTPAVTFDTSPPLQTWGRWATYTTAIKLPFDRLEIAVDDFMKLVAAYDSDARWVYYRHTDFLENNIATSIFQDHIAWRKVLADYILSSQSGMSTAVQDLTMAFDSDYMSAGIDQLPPEPKSTIPEPAKAFMVNIVVASRTIREARRLIFEAPMEIAVVLQSMDEALPYNDILEILSINAREVRAALTREINAGLARTQPESGNPKFDRIIADANASALAVGAVHEDFLELMATHAGPYPAFFQYEAFVDALEKLANVVHELLGSLRDDEDDEDDEDATND